MSDINPENVAEFQHKEWLSQTMTQQLLTRIQEFREKFIISSSALVFSQDAPDRAIYANLACVRNCDAIINLIKDTEKFLNKPPKE